MKSVDKAISASKSKIHNTRFVFTQIHVELFLDLNELLEVEVYHDGNRRQIERLMRKYLGLFK